MRHAFAPSATALLALLLAACTGKSAPETVLLDAAGSAHEGMLGWQSVTDETVRLATTGTVDVDVQVFAGDVTVVWKPTLRHTEVTVRRTGSHGWFRESESMESLGEIRYTVTLEQAEGRDRAVVRAGTDHVEPHFQAVDVEIAVPDLGAVRILTDRGNVWVEGNRGAAEVKSSHGKIRLMTPWKIDTSVSLVTSDGDIDLRLRGESTGAVDAATVGGQVKTRIKYGKWVATHGENDADSLRATMNDGTNPITLRTSNADVMLSVLPNPVSQNPAPAIW
ncbi:MAG: DUF4097 family beta strand repeat protein [Phycisphaerae bacterium]|jgi:hypothetical protein|nr:DUF4097 family beta strand repeat protein [Phycisphaerae bacterium]